MEEAVMSTMAEEDVDLGLDLDSDPVCSGRINADPDGSITYEEGCTNTAEWVKVTKHCGVRGLLKCNKHYEMIRHMWAQCIVCHANDVPHSWVRL
jgi:hypothetical protein